MGYWHVAFASGSFRDTMLFALPTRSRAARTN